MWCRIIYCASIILATASVILLALFSPNISHNYQHYPENAPQLTLSFYFKQSNEGQRAPPPRTTTSDNAGSALVYHRVLAEGPGRGSRVVGRAQGFVIPSEGFDRSGFNIMYLTFDDDDGYSGSVCVRAAESLLVSNGYEGKEKKMDVVGGTGSFAFARGYAVFEETDRASYRMKLFLNFSNRSLQVIPGS